MSNWVKAAWFAGGVATVGVVKAISQSKAIRNAAVTGVSKCMQFNDSVQEATQNFMDDAQDMRAEAKRKSRIDAAVAERLASLENGIREEVEASIDGKPAAAQA